MPLEIGTRVGAYQVTAKLGEGGMGTVYRAHDTTLGREVALKLLSEGFTTDPDRLIRFRREAKVLASLNHPNIGSIYGLESTGEAEALVLELIEGQTLVDLIGDGPLSVDDATAIAEQIANALEAAHEQGIVHRDLKPANVKVRPDGTVKVLDFGLAKAIAAERGSTDASEQATTSLTGATQMGMVIGTPAYMAPEQAKGQPVDKRADVWAFGVVLLEMLTGRRVFEGETASETVAAVMMREPDWDRLPGDLPATLDTVIRQCLQKDPRERVRDVGDVRLAMRGAFETSAAPPAATAAGSEAPVWKSPIAWLSGAFTLSSAGLLLALMALDGSPPDLVSTRFVEAPAGRMTFPRSARAVALSPDGQQLVYSANDRLYLRQLDQATAEAIPGTENASAPFFSPDGQWVGFFTETEIRKVALSGGAPLTVCQVTNGLDGAWTDDDTIVFGITGPTALFQVSAQGGSPEPLTERQNPAADHDFPAFLPGGDVMLFSVARDGVNFDAGQIVAQRLSTGERRVVADGGFYPRWLSSGHLLYARGGGLFVAPFDRETLDVTGDPREIVSGVMQTSAGAHYATSLNGSLVYVPGGVTSPIAAKSVLSVDREGIETALPIAANDVAGASIAPDGRNVALTIATVEDLDVWIADATSGTVSRLTTHPGFDMNAFWNIDGSGVVFASDRTGEWGLYQQPVDASGDPQLLVEIPGALPYLVPESWTPGGGRLVFTYHMPGESYNIGVLENDGSGAWSPLLDSPGLEKAGRVSPDGRWIAYVSNETGVSEVFIEPFPGLGLKTQVSSEGGQHPVWSPDGQELYYRTLTTGTLMSVQVTVDPTLTVGSPAQLGDGEYALQRFGQRIYDLFPDGDRFLVFRVVADEPDVIHVVLNAFKEL